MLDDKTVDLLLDQLKDPNPEKRKEAWDRVHRILISGRTNMPYEIMRKLVDLKSLEEVHRVFRAADRALSVTILSETPVVSPGPPPPADAEPPAPKTQAEPAQRKTKAPKSGVLVHSGDIRLCDWAWQAFCGPSLVVRVADPEKRRRDEEAVIELARRLGWQDYPATRFVRVGLGEFALPVKELEVDGVCFVGRLGLYGPQAVCAWTMQDARFRFGTEDRPDWLQPGHLDREKYHVILEDLRDDEPLRYETGDDEDNQRTDYGLVQSYVVWLNNRQIRVVVCAGSSSLGTLAATYWAGHDLFLANQEGKFMMLPERVKADSRLEALVKVTADSSRSTYTWELGNVKLLHLRLDGYVWNQQEFDWDRRTAKRITVLHECSAGRDFSNSAVIDLLLDGDPSRMTKSKSSFRLLVAICRLAHDNGGRVDIRKLAAHEWIWGKAVKHVDDKWLHYVRTRVWNLKKHHLGQAIVIGDEQCVLLADVRYRAVQDVRGRLRRDAGHGG